MSWTPTFWIHKNDFIVLKRYLFALDEFCAWEFSIAGKDGVVLSTAQTTSAHRELHECIKDIVHWVLTGEVECCEKSVLWGDELSEFSYSVQGP